MVLVVSTFGLFVSTTAGFVFLAAAAGSGPVYGGGAGAGPRGRFFGRPGFGRALQKLQTSLLRRASESRSCGSVMAIQTHVQTAPHFTHPRQTAVRTITDCPQFERDVSVCCFASFVILTNPLCLPALYWSFGFCFRGPSNSKIWLHATRTAPSRMYLRLSPKYALPRFQPLVERFCVVTVHSECFYVTL